MIRCYLGLAVAAALAFVGFGGSEANGQEPAHLAITSRQAANRSSHLIPSYQPCALRYQELIERLKAACKAGASEDVINDLANQLEAELRNVRPRDYYGPEICQPPVRGTPFWPPQNVLDCPCQPPPCACPASRTKER